MRTRVLIAATILLLLPCAARGAGAPSLRAAIAKTPPVIDGELSDEEWAGAAHFSSFVQFEPHRGNPAREKTEAYFLYDEGHLYFAFRCWDSVPESITARITQRDGELERDDSVLVVPGYLPRPSHGIRLHDESPGYTARRAGEPEWARRRQHLGCELAVGGGTIARRLVGGNGDSSVSIALSKWQGPHLGYQPRPYLPALAGVEFLGRVARKTFSNLPVWGIDGTQSGR